MVMGARDRDQVVELRRLPFFFGGSPCAAPGFLQARPFCSGSPRPVSAATAAYRKWGWPRRRFARWRHCALLLLGETTSAVSSTRAPRLTASTISESRVRTHCSILEALRAARLRVHPRLKIRNELAPARALRSAVQTPLALGNRIFAALDGRERLMISASRLSRALLRFASRLSRCSNAASIA